MTQPKCKKCGGTIEFEQGATVGVCKSCGAKQSLQPDEERHGNSDERTNATVATLLRRVSIFLEDEDWDNADAYCERVLDLDPENAEAYLGKLMADHCVAQKQELAKEQYSFENEPNYRKIIRFGDEALKSEISGYLHLVNRRIENKRLSDVYEKAVALMNGSAKEQSFREAASIFNSIPGFKDSDRLAGECLEKAEIIRKDGLYESAKSKMAREDKEDYEAAISIFQTIPGWKDSDEQIETCKNKIYEIERNTEEKRVTEKVKEEKSRKIRAVLLPIAAILLTLLVVYSSAIAPNNKYSTAMKALNAGDYETAISLFEQLGDRRDSREQLKKAKYGLADNLVSAGKYDNALVLYKELSDDQKITETSYLKAVSLYERKEYHDAFLSFYTCHEYKDSDAYMDDCKAIMLKEAKPGDYIFYGYYEQDNVSSNGEEPIEWLVLNKGNDHLHVTSKYGLDYLKYHYDFEETMWTKCGIKDWLNTVFYLSAFSFEEMERIADIDMYWEKEKVILLYPDDAEKLFSSDEARILEVTDYAKAQGAEYYGDGARWWLLLNTLSDRAPFVMGDGRVIAGSAGLDKMCKEVNTAAVVRPCIYIYVGD